MKTNMLYFALLAIALGVLAIFRIGRSKPQKPESEPMTFDEFVQYGREHGKNTVNGVPWSFYFHGVPVTHETDRKYSIWTRSGKLSFTPWDIISLDDQGGVVITKGAMTFDEFVQYGREHGNNIVGGMPWSFQFHGHPVSHEHDCCYLICTGNTTLSFVPGDTIALDARGDVVITKGSA